MDALFNPLPNSISSLLWVPYNYAVYLAEPSLQLVLYEVECMRTEWEDEKINIGIDKEKGDYVVG